MARVINYGDDDLRANQRMMRSLSNDAVSNPFAFAAPAPVAPVAAPVAAPATAPVVQAAAPVGSRRGDVGPPPLSQTQGFGMVPVYQETRGGRGPLLGYQFDESVAAQQGIVETPKPPAILAEEKRLGGKELEPVYAETTVSRGRGGASETVKYGPPIGYRYDNGQSQYVNFDASGEYQGTVKRQSTIESALPFLAIAALPFLGPMAFEALGLTGAAGGAGLLADTAAFIPGEIASLSGGGAATAANLTPAAIESLLGTAGYGVNASALEAALAAGIPAAQVGAGALLPFPGAPTPIPTPTPTPPPQLTPAAIESGLGTPGYGVNASAVESGLFNPELIGSGAYLPFEGVTPTAAPPADPSKLPSWATVPNALLAASVASSIANANKTEPTAPTFTMAPYVPPSGKPFANLGMSPIATPYTPTRILGQYDPTMTPGGVSPYELIMQQMQAPKNLYADFEAGTNIGGYDPQRFVVPPAAAAAALPNNMGGMIDKSRMVGPNPMGPDNGFASIQDGEFVMNRKATAKYGIELMNAINSGKISKGKLIGLLEA